MVPRMAHQLDATKQKKNVTDIIKTSGRKFYQAHVNPGFLASGRESQLRSPEFSVYELE